MPHTLFLQLLQPCRSFWRCHFTSVKSHKSPCLLPRSNRFITEMLGQLVSCCYVCSIREFRSNNPKVSSLLNNHCLYDRLHPQGPHTPIPHHIMHVYPSQRDAAAPMNPHLVLCTEHQSSTITHVGARVTCKRDPIEVITCRPHPRCIKVHALSQLAVDLMSGDVAFR